MGSTPPPPPPDRLARSLMLEEVAPLSPGCCQTRTDLICCGVCFGGGGRGGGGLVGRSSQSQRRATAVGGGGFVSRQSATRPPNQPTNHPPNDRPINQSSAAPQTNRPTDLERRVATSPGGVPLVLGHGELVGRARARVAPRLAVLPVHEEVGEAA